MDLFDTHAHLADEQLAADIAGVIERAAAAGVTRILAVGTTAANSGIAWTCPTAAGCSFFRGIHPNHAAEAQPGDWDEIVRLAGEAEVVALGETGLDLYWKDTPPTTTATISRTTTAVQATNVPGRPLAPIHHLLLPRCHHNRDSKTNLNQVDDRNMATYC